MKTFLAMTFALLAVAPNAQADEPTTLLDSTYMERGSVALVYRVLPVLGQPTSAAGCEWSWAAHSRLSLGISVASATAPIHVTNPDNPSQTKKANLTQFAVRLESNISHVSSVLIWPLLKVAPDFEIGFMQLGYRGQFTNDDDHWRGSPAPYAALGATTYVHVSPESDVGIALGYQKTRGAVLKGFTDQGLSGAVVGLRFKRWF